MIGIKKLDLSKISALYTLVSATIFLNILKFWADFLLGINHQLITAIQMILPILFFILLWKNISKSSVTAVGWIFILYHILRCLVEIIVLSITDFSLGLFLGIIFSLSRVLIIFSLFMLLFVESRRLIDCSGLLIFYFLYTTIFSLLQLPDNPYFTLLQLPASPVSHIFSNYGGNSTSGNALGIFRANGGLGGTVISYSNYLLAVFILLFFGRPQIQKYRTIIWAIFLVATILCFSRSLFLSVAVIVILYGCVKKPILFIICFILAFILIYINGDLIFDSYKTMTGASDKYRIEMWINTVENFDILTILMGQRTGANTGFYVGMRKITADGFIFAWYYDYGMIGSLLLLWLLWRSIGEVRLPVTSQFAVFLAIMAMLTVNSGFDKAFIIIIYFSTFMTLKANSKSSIYISNN